MLSLFQSPFSFAPTPLVGKAVQVRTTPLSHCTTRSFVCSHHA